MEETRIKGMSNSSTHYFDNDLVVWPCVCGETHENVYDWLHHVCLHNDLVGMYRSEKEGIIIAYCAECGKGFEVDLKTVEG